MNEQSKVLYGHPTSSDVQFMLSDTRNMSLDSLSSTSSTRSDAESAPPDFEEIVNRISNEYTKWVGRQLPPEWTMPDLVRAVISDDRIDSPGFLTNDYYDVMLHGQNAWLCEQIFYFIDLINHSFFLIRAFQIVFPNHLS